MNIGIHISHKCIVHSHFDSPMALLFFLQNTATLQPHLRQMDSISWSYNFMGKIRLPRRNCTTGSVVLQRIQNDFSSGFLKLSGVSSKAYCDVFSLLFVSLSCQKSLSLSCFKNLPFIMSQWNANDVFVCLVRRRDQDYPTHPFQVISEML